MKLFNLIGNVLLVIEKYFLVALLLVLIGFSVSQILMRNFMESGFLWGDQFIRVLVLWIGLTGAMYASRMNKHIRIDIVSHYFPEKLNKNISIVANFATAIICSLASWYSLIFVIDEYQYGDIAFAKVPVWITESIIPFALAILALRFFIASFMALFNPSLEGDNP